MKKLKYSNKIFIYSIIGKAEFSELGFIISLVFRWIFVFIRRYFRVISFVQVMIFGFAWIINSKLVFYSLLTDWIVLLEFP